MNDVCNISVSGYGRYESQNYGVNCLRVDVGGLRLWFSYSTVIAFQADGPARVCENCWAQTTGKHLNWIDGGDKAARLGRGQFEAELAAVLKAHNLT